MVRVILLLVLFALTGKTYGQQGPFHPQAGELGSNAIHKDSTIIRFWATSCQFNAGLRQINLPDSGVVNSGNANYTIGKADAPLALSLGDSGLATFTFAGRIYNDEGPDLVVFENGFGFGEEAFLEFAFVEVSSDGEHFFRFPAQSLRDTSAQLSSFGYSDASFYHNLAGKYIANYGVPFDLDEIPDTNLLDKSNVSHVRVVDVIGTINPEFASRDAFGRIINDPWPTNFPQGGFDLDAIGVIHSTIPLSIKELQSYYESTSYELDLLGRVGSKNATIELRQNPDGSILKIIRAD
jgi:hypothetical protein